MLQKLVNDDVVVRLKWGETEYHGKLVSIDSYLNLQLSGTKEYIDGKATGDLGQVLIRYVLPAKAFMSADTNQEQLQQRSVDKGRRSRGRREERGCQDGRLNQADDRERPHTDIPLKRARCWGNRGDRRMAFTGFPLAAHDSIRHATKRRRQTSVFTSDRHIWLFSPRLRMARDKNCHRKSSGICERAEGVVQMQRLNSKPQRALCIRYYST